MKALNVALVVLMFVNSFAHALTLGQIKKEIEKRVLPTGKYRGDFFGNCSGTRYDITHYFEGEDWLDGFGDLSAQERAQANTAFSHGSFALSDMVYVGIVNGSFRVFTNCMFKAYWLSSEGERLVLRKEGGWFVFAVEKQMVSSWDFERFSGLVIGHAMDDIGYSMVVLGGSMSAQRRGRR